MNYLDLLYMHMFQISAHFSTPYGVGKMFKAAKNYIETCLLKALQNIKYYYNVK